MLTSPTGGPQLIRDDTKSNRRNSGSQRKLEYRIDCHGYTADELEVYIQGRDLMVQGKTNTSISSDPTQQRVSKKFTRKITLPNTVDLSKVVSYLEHGELRIEAPLKRGIYYSDEEIIIPGPPPPSTSTANRTAAALISNLETRVRSPSPQNRTHYRRNERAGRRRDYDRSTNRRLTSPVRRIRSVESHRYPFYVPSRDLDEDDDDDDQSKERVTRRQRTVIRGPNKIDTKETEQRRSIYSPTNVTSTISRHHDYPSDDDYNLKF
jgi:hypothetical protein